LFTETYGSVEYSSTHSYPRHQMEISQLYLSRFTPSERSAYTKFNRSLSRSWRNSGRLQRQCRESNSGHPVQSFVHLL